MVVFNFDKYDLPLLCQIVEFLIAPTTEELFIYNPLTVNYYSEHYHAYLAETTSEFVFLQQKDLLDCHPLNLVTPPGTSQSFVSLKYHLFKK